MTEEEAADMLGVPRHYLVRLLDDGQLPCTKQGEHRRLRLQDVIAFREKRDSERRSALRNLTALTEELGGYEPEFRGDESSGPSCDAQKSTT